MRWPSTAAVAAVASLLPTAAGLFEDEVGQYEWNLQQIGKPVALAYAADASDRIFVASASGAVASVLLKDGTMQWRRMASTNGAVRLLRAANRGLVSVTESGSVQSWKGTTGDLIWQRDYSEPVLDLLLLGPAAKQTVAVLRKGEIEARTMAGKHEWSLTTGQADSALKAAFWAAASSPDDAGTICAINAEADGGSPASVHVKADTGKVAKTEELPKVVGTGLRRGTFMVVDAFVVTLVKGQLNAAPMCGGVGSSFDLPTDGEFKLSKWQRTGSVFAVSNGATTLIFGIGEKGIKKLRVFEGTAVVGPIFSVHEDETGQPVAVAVTKEDGTQIQLMDPASGNVQPAMFAKGYAAADHGPAELLLMHELRSGEHRTVISAGDHSFAGIQGDKVMWVREEALASIHQAVFYSRSTAATLAERQNKLPQEASQGLAALAAQLTGLPARLAELVQEPTALVAAFTAWVTPKRARSRKEMKLAPGARAPTSCEELRDFGADKLVLVITASLKLFALEATTSEIVWQKYLGASGQACDAMADCGPTMRLLPSSSAPISELLLMVPAAGGHQVFWIEPLTGKIHRQEALPATASRLASLLPLMPRRHAEPPADGGVQPFLLIDDKRQVYTLPSGSESAQKLVKDSEDRLFHYEVDDASQSVQGFSVKKNGLTRLWNIELGEPVVASAAPEHREYPHVPVYIKGDSTILYKYINTNLLAVATEESGGASNATSLNLYILDSVTGHVLHQSHVPGGAKPVHLVACDNFVVMHYQNPKRTRFEITVVELFQAKADDGPWDIIFGGGQSKNQTKSAHHLESPIPLQQTYIFPVGVTAMATTATLKGITPRSIIMALTTEHIFRVGKEMLNPRRPYIATGAAAALGGKDNKLPAQFAPTKEEFVPPYAPMLPVKAIDTLTHTHSVGQVRGMISSPSGLESTSLVFCYGLDLFFTPVQSAKAYDVLSPGFNYLVLYLSVGIVVVLWAVTSYFASRKALQERWK